MIELVSGCNKQGYVSALLKSFSTSTTPVKSSFCEQRKKVKFNFFKDCFEDLIDNKDDSKKRLFKGLKVYGMDGIELHLPRTKDILANEYRGRRTYDHKTETYEPRMYTVQAVDVLNKVHKGFEQSSALDEINLAQRIIPSFEENSLCIYDRLYPARKIFDLHVENNNYFLIRCPRKGVVKPIQQFFKSKKRKTTFEYKGQTFRLVKIKSVDGDNVFVSNLPANLFNKPNVSKLYQLRWEAENIFRDLTEVMQLEKWHSKSLNGILQEVYARLWLYNYSRIQMLKSKKKIKTNMLIKRRYCVPNFKVIYHFLRERISKILEGKRYLEDIEKISKLTGEWRKRYSRKYPRELKTAGSPYPRNNTIKDYDFTKP